MARKVFSILCYVVAGHMIGTLCMLALVLPWEFPSYAKFAIMGILMVPASIAWLIGLKLAEFRGWRRITGIILVAGAGEGAMVGCFMAAVVHTPELKNAFPEFGHSFDYRIGIGTILFIAAAGVILIMGLKPAGGRSAVTAPAERES